MLKKINASTGEVLEGKNTFACFRDFRDTAQKDFDKYYVERTIKQVVKKTGDGEDDFIIIEKEIENKKDIAEVINAQAGDAGIEAYLKPYLMTGEQLPAVQVSDDVQDFSNMPDNLADAIAVGDAAKKAFSKLDSKLTKGMSYEDFITSITQKGLEEYFQSLAKKEIKPQEGDK